MKSFHLKISSPEGDIFSGEAEMLSLRTTEGELAILESLFEIAHQNGISVSLYNYGISTTILLLNLFSFFN